MTRRDLVRFSPIRAALRSRWPQLMLMAASLGGLTLAIAAGFAGTPVGSRNFGIVTVWIGWWAALILVAVPLLGRGWCSICPIPAPGEWLQRGAVLGPGRRGLGFGRRWPRKLRNIWLQNGAFVLLALFAAVVLTQPRVTALVLLGLVSIAVSTSLVFERRAFCRYLCPVGGFIGLYSQLAPVELRVRDTAVCAKHTPKTCYTGNDDGYGCPWQVFPAGLIKNINCGLCFECIRACPYGNIALNLRPFGADLLHPRGRRLDEAFKALILLGTAIAYIVVMLGPWGELKSAAYAVGSLAWLLYALAFLVFVLALVPGVFLLCVLLGRKIARTKISVRKAFAHFAYALIPLGLASWIAFSLAFVLPNLSYVWPVLSDPFGWGWNLIGTAGLTWTPYFTRGVPFLQVGTLVTGLLWSNLAARRIARQLSNPDRTEMAVPWGAVPVSAFGLALTLTVLVLLVG